MEQYIPKAALVAEIERLARLLPKEEGLSMNLDWARNTLSCLYGFLNAIEVKEVDLEIEQRMKECPYRQVVCTMYEGKILECKGACSWVVDYPKLKELKAQKGE